MKEKQLAELLQTTASLRNSDREAAENYRNEIVSRMVQTAHQETDRIEHHLLEMPLSVIIYKWFILRLKSRPWGLLVPASLAIGILLQGLLSRFNLLQFLGH